MKQMNNSPLVPITFEQAIITKFASATTIHLEEKGIHTFALEKFITADPRRDNNIILGYLPCRCAYRPVPVLAPRSRTAYIGELTVTFRDLPKPFGFSVSLQHLFAEQTDVATFFVISK